MKSLVFWGTGGVGGARARQREGVTLLSWGDAAGAAMRAAGVVCEAAEARLGAEHVAWRDTAADGWTSAWPQLPLIDGRCFAEEATWKGESLGWCAGPLFHRPGRSSCYVALLETFRLLLEAEAPDEVEAVGLARDETLLLGRLCNALRILFHGPPSTAPSSPLSFRLRRAREAAASLWTAVRPRRSVRAATAAPVLWLLDEEPSPPSAVPGGEAGEPPPFRADVTRYSRGGVFSELRRARVLFRHQWQRLRKSPGLQDLFRHRGVTFADLGQRDLAELMLFELPRAVRRYEEVAATLRALGPRLALLRAEDKAAQAACRACAVPFVFFRGFRERAAAAPDRGGAPGVVG